MTSKCSGRATKVEDVFSVGENCQSETDKSVDFLSHARSKIIGYCSTMNCDMPLRSPLDRADISAAVLDHDYFEKNHVEYWIDRALKVGRHYFHVWLVILP